MEKDFNSVYSRLVLCKTFRLNEDGKVLLPEELLYRCVEAVNFTHNPQHAQMDVKLRSLICMGLNEQVYTNTSKNHNSLRNVSIRIFSGITFMVRSFGIERRSGAQMVPSLELHEQSRMGPNQMWIKNLVKILLQFESGMGIVPLPQQRRTETYPRGCQRYVGDTSSIFMGPLIKRQNYQSENSSNCNIEMENQEKFVKVQHS